MNNNEVRLLRAALLWLRNHYEVGRPEEKDAVLTRVDSILANHNPTSADLELMRRMYPMTDTGHQSQDERSEG